MKFSRERLRKAVVTAIENDHAEHDAKQVRTEQAHEELRALWRADYEKDWRNFATWVNDILDQPGGVITLDDFPQSRGPYRNNRIAVFDRQPQRQTAWVVPPELSQLLAILDSLEEDVISLYALKQLGFGQGAMAKVSNYLVGQP